MVKSSNLPIILKEGSGPEESFDDREDSNKTASDIQDGKYPEDQRAKPSRWTMLSKMRKPLPVNFEDNLESGNIEQEKFPDTTSNSSQPSVCGELKDDITIKSKQIVDNKGSLSTSIVRSFVQINGINLGNISKLTTLPECRNSLEYEEETPDMKTLRKMLKR